MCFESGGHHGSVAFADAGQRVSHEVDPAALPGSAEYFSGGGLEPFVRVADDEFDAAQTPARQ